MNIDVELNESFKEVNESKNWHYTEGMKPQPYLYPAMKQHEQELAKKLGSAVTLELK